MSNHKIKHNECLTNYNLQTARKFSKYSRQRKGKTIAETFHRVARSVIVQWLHGLVACDTNHATFMSVPIFFISYFL